MSDKFQISERLKEVDEHYHNGVYYDKKNKLSIVAVSNWSNEFYFKFYDLSKPISPNDLDSYEMCRISMTEPKYIGESDETFIPNKKQIKWLIRSLRKLHINIYNLKGICNNWKFMINEMNYEHELVGDIDQYRCPNLPIPDYSKLI